MLPPSEAQSLYKLGNGAAQDEPFTYPNVWAQETAKGVDRLVVAPRANQVQLVESLLAAMPEPIWLLYVLVVARGEGKAGRYQSADPLSRENTTHFLKDFAEFLERDARQNLWLRSESGEALLVYDRHNLLYAYGPLPAFMQILTQHGLAEVQQEVISIPGPHSHHYHQAFDPQAERILRTLDWRWTPLRKQDEP